MARCLLNVVDVGSAIFAAPSWQLQRFGFVAVSGFIFMLALLSYGCLPPPVDDSTAAAPEFIMIDYTQVDPPDEVVTTNRNQAQTATVFDMTTAVSNSLGNKGQLYFYWYVDWKPTNPSDPVTPDESSGVFTFLTCSEHDQPDVTDEIITYPLERRIMVVITTRPIPKAVKKNAYQAKIDDDADVVFYDWTLKFTDTASPNCDPPSAEVFP
ncbi:MAG: hypothetical protein HUU55_10400 [Myxococcales bacterium]|nr:hypothetical protein [Myxococcales bacterium]